ncbi:MAG: DUF1700 domain-containing protein [Spirochaetales bacterium]|nr:DUF1700 domain-containing protein [Spirochaetales bacterium]
MTEKRYLRIYERGLQRLSSDDRKEILEDCQKHFRRGLQQGYTAHEIAEDLGSPSELARAACDEFRDESNRRFFSVIMSFVGMFFFNLIFVLGLFCGFVGVMIGLWASAIALVFGGVMGIFVPVLEPLLLKIFPTAFLYGTQPRVAVFFAGIAVCSLGALAVFGMRKLTKWFLKSTRAYWDWNCRVVKGR